MALSLRAQSWHGRALVPQGFAMSAPSPADKRRTFQALHQSGCFMMLAHSAEIIARRPKP